MPDTVDDLLEIILCLSAELDLWHEYRSDGLRAALSHAPPKLVPYLQKQLNVDPMAPQEFSEHER